MTQPSAPDQQPSGADLPEPRDIALEQADPAQVAELEEQSAPERDDVGDVERA